MMIVRMITISLLVLIIAIYHSTGLMFLHWPDSTGYLSQALSILGADSYIRPGGRNIGYPLFLAPLLKFSTPALAVIVAQSSLVLLAYILLYQHLIKALPTLVTNKVPSADSMRKYLPLLLVATASHGAMHILILSMLTEILFMFLVLMAVMSVCWLVYSDYSIQRTLMYSTASGVVVALPLLVKPHWIIATIFLELIISILLAAKLWQQKSKGHWVKLGVISVVFLPFLTMQLVSWPDKYLGELNNSENAQLFGPLTVFCNHMHYIDDIAQKYPEFLYHREAHIDHAIRARVKEIRKSYKSGWRRLGFAGDLCTYDAEFRTLLAKHMPTLEERRSFLLGSVMRAATFNPLPFTGKVLKQLWFGLVTTFEKFSPYYSFEQFRNSYSNSVKIHSLTDHFLAGTRQQGQAGLFASKSFIKNTFIGQLVHGVIAVFFTLGAVIYAGLFIVSILLPFRFWDKWNNQKKKAFCAFLATPIIAIFGNNLLVALTHSFDVWRYGFNIFFVNIAFLISASIFWWDEYKRREFR